MTVLIKVWFFMVYAVSTGVSQAGPFVSLAECERARTVIDNTLMFSRQESGCYEGVLAAIKPGS